MTIAPTPTEKSKKQRVNTKTPPKTSITQRLRTDLRRLVGVTIATQLVWLNRFTGYFEYCEILCYFTNSLVLQYPCVYLFSFKFQIATSLTNPYIKFNEVPIHYLVSKSEVCVCVLQGVVVVM